MANPPGNPDLASVRVPFAVGDGRRRGGDKAWSIRNQMRWIAAQDIDITAPDALKQLFGDKPTIAQRAAYIAVLQASRDDDRAIRAIEFSDERIDGKLPQTTINAELERIKSMTKEEINDELKRVEGELEQLSASPEAGNAAPAEGAEGNPAEVQPV